MRIFIIGAGEVGYTIAHSLVREGHDLVLVDRDRERVESLRHTLDLLAVHGDGCDANLLRDHGVNGVDRFFAVTNDSAANVLAALTARRLGAQHCLVRVGFDYARRPNPLVDDDPSIVPIYPEELVARELLGLTRIGGASRVHFFEQDRLALIKATPAREADVYGRPLRELQWPEGWVLTGVVRKGGEIEVPDGNTRLLREQPIYALGRTDRIPEFEEYLGIRVEPTRRVVIAGAGQVGTSLARLLVDEEIDVTVVEPDEQRAFALAALLPEATVLHGDATDPTLLREANVAETDFFVAATADDMTNVLSSLLARQLGANTEVALYHRQEFLHVMRASRIDLPLSPRLMIAGTILKTVHRREILTLDLVGTGDAEVVDFEVPLGAKVLKKPLKELRFPNSVVGVIVRGEELIIPDGEFMFQPMDHVLVFTLSDMLPSLETLFQGR